jgi:hypothetical protein
MHAVERGVAWSIIPFPPRLPLFNIGHCDACNPGVTNPAIQGDTWRPVEFVRLMVTSGS